MMERSLITDGLDLAESRSPRPPARMPAHPVTAFSSLTTSRPRSYSMDTHHLTGNVALLQSSTSASASSLPPRLPSTTMLRRFSSVKEAYDERDGIDAWLEAASRRIEYHYLSKELFTSSDPDLASRCTSPDDKEPSFTVFSKLPRELQHMIVSRIIRPCHLSDIITMYHCLYSASVASTWRRYPPSFSHYLPYLSMHCHIAIILN